MTETPNPHIRDADTMTGEMRPIRQAVLSLGSNLGERLPLLQGAIDTLADTPGISVVAVSPVYETAPIDAVVGSGDFLNIVLLVDTTLSVHTLLERALAVEDAFGRERVQTSPRAATPRTLDVDLVVVGERVANDPELVLPHPRAHVRAFVLQPWLDIDPEAAIPGQGTVADLVDKVDGSTVSRRDDLHIVI